jgi:hypothetical protein
MSMTRSSNATRSRQHAGEQAVREQFVRIARYYQRAYGLEFAPSAGLAEQAVSRWLAGSDHSPLGPIMAVIETLDNWRVGLPAACQPVRVAA